MMWRRLDTPGQEWARLLRTPVGPVLRGTAVFLEEGLESRLDYRIRCDARWETREAKVQGWIGDRRVALALERRDGRWTRDGKPLEAVAGCEDLDLSFSPATNLFALRRLGLEPGQEGRVRSAWLRYPALDLVPLEQGFRRKSPSLYDYWADTGFTTRLEVDPEGFVTDYPPFWSRVSAGS